MSVNTSEAAFPYGCYSLEKLGRTQWLREPGDLQQQQIPQIYKLLNLWVQPNPCEKNTKARFDLDSLLDTRKQLEAGYFTAPTVPEVAETSYA